LQKRYRFPDHVKVMDGGTQGIYPIEHVQAADVLIVFDAIDYCLPPATLKCIANEEGLWGRALSIVVHITQILKRAFHHEEHEVKSG
jgi:hydrogenase maturation protease